MNKPRTDAKSIGMKDDDDTLCYRYELEAAVKAAVEAEREATAKRCADIAEEAEPYQAADLIRKAFGVDPMPLFDDWPGGWKK